MSEATTFPTLGGWLDTPERHVLAGAFPAFSQVAPHLLSRSQAAAPTDILLYKALRDANGGSYPDYPAQQIGDCVGQGHGHGNDLLQAVEIAMGDETMVFSQTSTEFIYATSREVAGILGRSDGSYGSAAVKAMTTIGMISRAMIGTDGAYSGQRAKDWGYRGAPQDLKTRAASYKLGAAAIVTDWDSLVAALSNGYPVTICSNQGFTLERDANGFCRARGTWGHCMLIGGIRNDIQGACIIQSWGSNMPTGPTALDQPSYSFWAERSVVERILSQGDSWALSKTPAFETRELPARWTYSIAS
jgi:hypothetical protein